MVTYEEFSKIELKVGVVVSAEAVKRSEKLIKFKVDLGEENPRQILAGVRQWYQPEDFVGKQIIVVANLEPRKMMGLESQGMILMADGPEMPVILIPQKNVPPGTKIR